MLGSSVLEVVLGLVFIYLLLSLICSSAKEGIEALLKKRAVNLECGIRELLHDPHAQGLVKDLYQHPLIDGLFRGSYEDQDKFWFGSTLPSYIPSKDFALALMDVILAQPLGGGQPQSNPPGGAGQLPGGRVADPLQEFRQAVVARITNTDVRQAMLALIDQAGGDIHLVRANIEAWFNSAMDRIAGWYKRWSQGVIFTLGLLLAVILNADTISIGHSLARDPSLRQSLVAAAEESAKKQPPATDEDPLQRVKTYNDELKALGLPLGWDRTDPRTWPGKAVLDWFLKALGLLLTALAISLGAPFWFDVLNRFMVVRSTVKPEEKSPKENPKP